PASARWRGTGRKAGAACRGPVGRAAIVPAPRRRGIEGGVARLQSPPVYRSAPSAPFPRMKNFGTPHTDGALRGMLLGSGELGKEVAIELQRLAVEVIAVDRYANAPA